MPTTYYKKAIHDSTGGLIGFHYSTLVPPELMDDRQQIARQVLLSRLMDVAVKESPNGGGHFLLNVDSNLVSFVIIYDLNALPASQAVLP